MICCNHAFSADSSSFYAHKIAEHSAMQHIFRCPQCSTTSASHRLHRYHHLTHAHAMKQCPYTCAHSASTDHGLIGHLAKPERVAGLKTQGHGNTRTTATKIFDDWQLQRNLRTTGGGRVSWNPPVFCISSTSINHAYRRICANICSAAQITTMAGRIWPSDICGLRK